MTISTHNVNGYSRNKDFLHSICDNNPNSIRAIQEHWLKPPYKNHSGVNQLRNLHHDFESLGTSAMRHSVESHIIKGRPYGGTAFLYNKKFTNCLKPLLNHNHERITVMRLETVAFHILLINIYSPYYNTRDLATHMSMYRDTIGYVENIIAENPGCQYIVLADLNCNLYEERHPYSQAIREFMSRHRLMSCYDKMPNFDYKSNVYTV